MRRLPRTLVLATAIAAATAMALPAAAFSPPSALATAASAEETTVLVGLDADVDAERVHRAADVGDVGNVIEQIDVHVVAVPPGTVDAAIAAYERLPGVAYAERNHTLALSGAPDDPLLEDQYQLDHINAVEGFTAYNDAVDAGPYAPTGGAKLAILDSGVDLTHPEFEDKTTVCSTYLTGTGTGLPGCQEANFHGTYVAGIASAIADNAEGIAGVGFDADLLVYQVCTYLCFNADTAAAMVDAADDGAEVANYSFGGTSPSETSQRAVAYADGAGVLQVSSAGNEGGNGHDTVTYPAAYPETVAVGATDRDYERADFSSYGPEVDVTAPGVGILSTTPLGTYSEYGLTFSGTSFSGPAVAGLGALLVNLGLDHEEARAAIVDGADPTAVGETGFTDEHGHGLADVGASVAIAVDGDGDGDGDGEEKTPPGHERRKGPRPGKGPNR